MPADFTVLIETYGLWTAIVLTIALPLIRDKFFPWLTAERNAMRAQEQLREERLFKLLEQNTTVFTELRVSVNNLDVTLREVRTDLKEAREDVARIYVHLGLDRRNHQNDTLPGL